MTAKPDTLLFPGQGSQTAEMRELVARRYPEVAGKRGKRAIRLPVAGAPYSASMAPAVAPFRAALDDLPLGEPASGQGAGAAGQALRARHAGRDRGRVRSCLA